jgi:metacaspase-1
MSKIALVMGLNYIGTSFKLYGCINDAHNIKKFLKNQYNYKDDEIVLMTDNTDTKPTRDNIINTLKDIVSKINDNNIKQLFISYSGHGTNVHDYSSDEDDKKDEVLVPLDVKQNGYIKDDIFHSILHDINNECVTFCLFDCCNSGTAVDLKYNHQKFLKYTVENKKTEMDNHVYMISGCKDVQTSVDAYNWETGEYEGVLTSSFLQVNKNNKKKLTYFKLVKKMKKIIKNREMKQIPQLTSSILIDKKSLYRDGNNHLMKDSNRTQEQLLNLKKKRQRKRNRRNRRKK